MAKSKPKFYIGQVVAVKSGYMHQGTYGQIAGRRSGKDCLEYWFRNGEIYVEFALRSQTLREIGPARPARRRSGKT